MLKVKFVKDYLSYKKDQIVELNDDEAAELIAAKKADKVEVNPTDELMTVLDEKIKVAVKESYKQASADFAAGVKAHNIVVGDLNTVYDRKGGFSSLGEYAMELKNLRIKGTASDKMRAWQAKAGATESTDGAAVPVEYGDRIISYIQDENPIMGNVTQNPTETESLRLPSDSLGTFGNNAVSGQWTAQDGATGTVTGAGLVKQFAWNLQKYLAIASLTSEIQADNNVALDAFLNKVAMRDLTYQVNHGIIRGNNTPTTSNVTANGSTYTLTTVNGLGGITGSSACVTVTAQAGDEYVHGTGIAYNDVTGMVGHFYPTPYGDEDSLVWIVGWDSYPQLLELTDPAGRNLAFATGGIGESPTGRLLGYKVIKSFHNAPLGTSGDIMLVDLKAYEMAVHKSGVQAATSIHLYFLQDATAFRWTYRTAGQPGLTAPFEVNNGAGTQLSPFVVLSNRT